MRLDVVNFLGEIVCEGQFCKLLIGWSFEEETVTFPTFEGHVEWLG